MDTVTANQGIDIITFVLSYNEILFIGWFLGIMEAKLVKKIKIDWGFAFFNLLLVICFWYITERFVQIGVAKSVFNGIGISVTFLIVGYGAYKMFQLMMRSGTPAVGRGFKAFINMFTGGFGKQSAGDSETDQNDKPGGV